MDEPKTIAGLHCFDVLELLDDYVADVLDDDVFADVNAHLAECGACASFGGKYSELVRVLHERLADVSEPESDAHDVAMRVLRFRSQ